MFQFWHLLHHTSVSDMQFTVTLAIVEYPWEWTFPSIYFFSTFDIGHVMRIYQYCWY